MSDEISDDELAAALGGNINRELTKTNQLAVGKDGRETVNNHNIEADLLTPEDFGVNLPNEPPARSPLAGADAMRNLNEHGITPEMVAAQKLGSPQLPPKQTTPQHPPIMQQTPQSPSNTGGLLFNPTVDHYILRKLVSIESQLKMLNDKFNVEKTDS